MYLNRKISIKNDYEMNFNIFDFSVLLWEQWATTYKFSLRQEM